MLILTRKVGEAIMIGDDIVVKVLGVRSGQVKIGIEAPRELPVHRHEIFERIIEIKALAREAGYRTKVAVSSIDTKVDAVGACVGVRGSRIKNIVEELGGEKIDIVRWNESSQILIANALKPAEVEEVSLCFELGRATIIVREDQLSLAIGRRGQNVRLAAKLGKWDISILTESEMQEGPEELEESPDRIGRFDDDLELGGAGLTGASEFDEPDSTRKG